MNLYAELFISFAKMGAVTFGGGYAMLPILQREAVERRGWVTETEIMDYYAIGQCLPGILATNTAIFVGNKVKGPLGGLVAALGCVFPSLVIITVIAAFISNFADLPAVQDAFAGIRVCVLVLIVNAILRLRKGAITDAVTALIAVAVFCLSVLTDVSPIVSVLAAAAIGIAVKALPGKGARAE